MLAKNKIKGPRRGIEPPTSSALRTPLSSADTERAVPMTEKHFLSRWRWANELKNTKYRSRYGGGGVTNSPKRPMANCMSPRAMALSWGRTHRRMSNMLPTSEVEWMNTNNENRTMYQKPESSQSSLQKPGKATVELSFMHWQSVYCITHKDDGCQ